MISMFVLAMMLLIEYITVQTEGKWDKALKRSPIKQILLGALLGIMPGCLGTFAAVTLYAHQLLSFAALVTVMIATSGDEIFVMLSIIPGNAFKLMFIIFLIAIAAGLLIHLIWRDKTLMVLPENHLKFHSFDPECICFDAKKFLPQLRNITFQRAMLLTATLLFLIFLLSGQIGPHAWNWKKIAFLIVSGIILFIAVTVPDHFLQHHLWEHVIKKHLPKIFLWTFGAFLIIHLLEEHIDIKNWIESNIWLVLLVAALVGIIPESGPHIVFITLFAHGTIPFSILLANSIVQDGHGAIPLLAESKRSFLAMKLVNFAIGFLAGAIGLLVA